jgi:hypothetical protein
LENCCNGIDIDPFVSTPADSVFDLGHAYYDELELLDKLILSKRKKVEQIVKAWTIKKNKETITYYLTPIKGRFCTSVLANTRQWRSGYNGKIFIPYSSFEVNLDFWNSPQFPILANIDFEKLKLNIIR